MKASNIFFLFIVLAQTLGAMDNPKDGDLYRDLKAQASLLSLYVPTWYGCCVTKFFHEVTNSLKKKNEIALLELLKELDEMATAKKDPKLIHAFFLRNVDLFSDEFCQRSLAMMLSIVTSELSDEHLSECPICLEVKANCIGSCGHMHCHGCIKRLEGASEQTAKRRKDGEFVLDKPCSKCRVTYGQYFLLDRGRFPDTCITCNKERPNLFFRCCGYALECKACAQDICKGCKKPLTKENVIEIFSDYED